MSKKLFLNFINFQQGKLFNQNNFLLITDIKASYRAAVFIFYISNKPAVETFPCNVKNFHNMKKLIHRALLGAET